MNFFWRHGEPWEGFEFAQCGQTEGGPGESFLKLINLFIFGCVGSSLLHVGFL